MYVMTLVRRKVIQLLLTRQVLFIQQTGVSWFLFADHIDIDLPMCAYNKSDVGSTKVAW